MSDQPPIVKLRNDRLNKLNAVRELGINPYPSDCSRTHYAQLMIDDYEKYEGQTVTVAGRLMSWRKQGGLTFGHIQDHTGKIQLFLGKQVLQPTNVAVGNLGYEHIKLFDVGDFVEATGTLKKTQQGEISVFVDTLRLLTKSLRPLPDKWEGLKNREAILRRRYLDTTIDAEHKKPFEAVSRMVFAIRTFLNQRGFLEFNTPVLQIQYGGGTAKPFITHLNALDIDVYLSISHELYLKRLIAAGFDKVYTIGRYFRNEGIDRSHHPEFSMIETMTAYENYEYNMDLIEDLFKYLAENVFGRTEFTIGGHKIDFGQPWKRISMVDALKEVTGIDFHKCQSVEEANTYLESLEIKEKQPSIGMAIAKAFEIKVEPTLISPTLVFGHPMDISPLAKPMESDPSYAERFEIFIAGIECGDNWSEQNDPIALLERWKSQYRSNNPDDDESHPLDYDFIEVLEHGIPPTTGIGPGIERIAMMFTEQENIDDVIFFPLMKPVISSSNAAIYGIEPISTKSVEEDIVLSIDDFGNLLSDQILRPQTSKIIIYPYLQIWANPNLENSQRRASGSVKLVGFLKNKQIQIVGYHLELEPQPNTIEESQKFKAMIELKLRDLLVAHFNECEVQVADVATLSAPFGKD